MRSVRRPWLRPLVPMYGLVTGARRWMSGWGMVGRRWLQAPVISVGSCSAGGAGKTPVVLLLTQLLTRRGYAVRILTRGYGRRSVAVERVNPEGDAGWYGDEPVLLAQRSGAPVFVGADRYEAGMLAEQEDAGDKVAVHVVDDGFQHWRLGREIDVVLLTQQDVEDALLPAGNLRESLAALRDADVIVLREEELEATRSVVDRYRRKERAPLVWVVKRRISFDPGVRMPERALAFCGIARPEGFVGMLRGLDVGVSGTVFFADHAEYGDAEISRVIEAAKASGADGFVTTEKDAVKLIGPLLERLVVVGPVVVAKLDLELIDEKAAVDGMITRVRAMDRRRGRKVWK